jgi:hypothetical protein
MSEWKTLRLAFSVLLISLTATAQEQGVVKPQLLFSEIVQGMPKGERQEVRVLTGNVIETHEHKGEVKEW